MDNLNFKEALTRIDKLRDWYNAPTEFCHIMGGVLNILEHVFKGLLVNEDMLDMAKQLEERGY
jgi:hypothetical protein